MNTSQLQCMIACDPLLRDSVLGVFAADQLPRSLPTHPCGFIVNTDNSNQPGPHWLAFVTDDSGVDCFDSYGRSPGSYNPLLSMWIHRYNKKVRVNATRLQSDSSNVCGLYCVLFLHDRLAGRTMSEIVNAWWSPDLRANDQFILNFMSKVFAHCFARECINNQNNQRCRPVCQEHPY